MYLHGKGLSHGDVKAGNVLVDFEGGAKLADLGTAQKVADSVELFSHNFSYVYYFVCYFWF